MQDDELVRTWAFWRTILTSAVVGIPVSLAALLFVFVFERGTSLIWYSLPAALGSDRPPIWMVLLVPTLGGLLVAVFRGWPGDGGHRPLLGFSGGPTLPRQLPSVLLAMLTTLCCGAVLGHEAPLMAIGTALAMLISSLMTKNSDKNTTQAVAIAGAAAALSVLFGNPLVAVVLLIEGMALTGAMRSLFVYPALVASGVGYLVFTGVGSFTGFNQPVLSIPPPPAAGTITWVDVSWTLVLAPLAAAFLILVRVVAGWLESGTSSRPRYLVVSLSGLVIALCAVGYEIVTGEDPRQILFSGQSGLPELADTGLATSLGVLSLLLLAKGVAFAVSLGGGFRGGPIFPSIFMGGLLGMIAAHMLPGMNPSAAFFVAMVAGTAASLKVPVGSILLVALIAGVASLELLPLILIGGVIGSLIRVLADLKATNQNVTGGRELAYQSGPEGLNPH